MGEASPNMVGRYRIVSLIGAGGMGEVYLARDTRLGRPVALKLLPARFTDDEERVRRFEREARAASALNHPNIITIYDIGAHEGAHYIATEFVDGRTLKQHAAEARPDPGEALGLALQIADALAAAHEAGIVHRDVKPENVMVRRDGYVKVLDFGLAKLTERAVSEGDPVGQSATALTETGAVMGTYAYMSPEQALGREVDSRSDIFSLGVVLYELVAGRHPFRGATAAATFDAILNREPPPLEHASAELMPELEHVVARALEKDRELRYQTASDLRAELKRLRRDLDSATPVSGKSWRDSARRKTRRPRRRHAFVALAALAVLTITAAFVYLAVRGPWSETRQTPSPLGNLGFTALTAQPGAELSPSLSPDGRTFVYAAKHADNWDIFAQRAGGRSARNLTADTKEDDAQPAFSPDGERIAFRSERQRGGIFVMGADGESVRRLTDFGHHPAWSPDGREVVFCTHKIEDPNDRYLDPSALWAINVSTGAVRRLTDEGAGDAVQPQWSPTGGRIAYWGKHKAGQRDIWTVPARGGAPVAVTDDAAFDWNPVWSPDGRHVYFASNRGGSMNLWRVPLDERTGRVTGQPESVTTPSRYAFHLSFSRDGRRAVFVNQTSSTHIYKAAFNPHREAITAPPVAVTHGFKHTSTPDLSPDGEWFAYSSQGETREDIYVIDKDGATAPRQLTDDEHKDRDPRWSPDGRSIVFYSNRTGKYEAWAVNADGSNPRQLTFTEGANVAYPFWSPDGSHLVFNRNEESATVIDL
ncbi:MAG TPA: protein kinase, partial [Pyrinomonadaceae bacterium]|nr:protein kinase [Pyrinomonadaceae bacterium]